MSSSIYAKLAVTNLKNNRKTYVPYILTAILTVMMYYMMYELTDSVEHIDVKMVMQYGVVIIAIFAVIFLFYTNSFLMKRRKKEIGVYNILGMGKPHVARMIMIETGITAFVSVACGIVLGIVFGKLMHLILLKLLKLDAGMKFQITPQAMVSTLLLFWGIFLLTLLYNLLQIQLTNPVGLLHGGNQGEKEPKTRWILAVFGIIALGAGYGIALTVEHPMEAFFKFFIAVVCVILGTYALFTAGSIALLKLLRSNKNYYYKTKHFTAVSGMIYRMKQNAVGLANICILSTMVLVMISATVSLYAGIEDAITTRYPYEFEVECAGYENDNEERIAQIVKEETENADVKIQKDMALHMGKLSAVYDGDQIVLEGEGSYSSLSDSGEVYMIPQEDYNQMEDENVALADNEVILYTTGDQYGKKTVTIGGREYQVVKEPESMRIEKKNRARIVEAYYIVFSNVDQIRELMNTTYGGSDMDEAQKQYLNRITYRYAFDLEGTEEEKSEAVDAVQKRIGEELDIVSMDSREESRGSFYILYGSLFFIGLYLGALFLMATVLIIYYKQISEGYDDKERFQIMQKVGMGKKEVKSSIRSQVLMVFFLPLVVAVIHIAVAFKVLTKLLALLNLVNVPLFLTCMIATVIVFSIFYGIVFMITAREYYKIVN